VTDEERLPLRSINTALKCLLVPVCVFFVLLALPLVGNVMVLEGAAALSCPTGENVVHPCSVLGEDAGSLVNGYLVDAFILGAFNPFLAGMAFLLFLRSVLGRVWIIVVGVLLLAKVVIRRQPAKREG
jgi:hypothetical protein